MTIKFELPKIQIFNVVYLNETLIRVASSDICREKTQSISKPK